MAAQQELDDAMDEDDVAKWAEQRRKQRAAIEAQHVPMETPFPVLSTPAPDYSPPPGGEANGKLAKRPAAPGASASMMNEGDVLNRLEEDDDDSDSDSEMNAFLKE